MRRRKILMPLVLLALAAPAAAQNDYRDPEYAERDMKNMFESTGRNQEQLGDPDFFQRNQEETSNHYDEHLVAQAEDPTHPAITPGLLFPGWYTANPEYWPEYRARLADGRAREVRFRTRTGAVLYGQMWKPAAAGTYPGISVTPGSVQATASMYWWAAQHLSDHGYVVLTFDAQGQGRSETFGHEDDANETPTLEGVPSQQDVNFLQATVDAVDFLLSSPSSPHPHAFAGDPAQGIDTFNPFSDSLEYLGDGFANLGIAGHSFGAQGVSFAQDPVRNDSNVNHIRAVVAWDNLSANYTPNVPAMGQSGESFTQPSFNPSRPNPESKKGAFNKWRAAGIDTMQIAPRAATHMEWAYVPYATAASNWGNDIAKHYTLAWFDKYLRGDPTADGRLLTKQYNTPNNQSCGGNDNCYSIYYKSAYAFRDAANVLRSCDDIAHIANAAACLDTDP